MALGRTARFIAVALGSLLAANAATAAEYIVKFTDAHAFALATQQEAFVGVTVREAHAPGALLKVDTGTTNSASDEAQMLAQLMHAPGVEYVVKNFKLKMLNVPNDPRLSEQWALAKVRATEAWDLNLGSRAVTVGIIDTGVDYTHPDLAANIWTNPAEIAGNGRDDDGNGLVDDVHGWDFLDSDADPMDVTSSDNPGHGTHCAGIIGAVGDNGLGTSGMNQKVSIVPMRFIGPTGQGDLMAAIRAIDYAIAMHVDVISASWGAQVAASQAQPLIEAIGRADTAGVVFVAAAANNGANNDTTEMYPANSPYANVIAVAASDNNDAKPSWSNYGKAMVALASPGLDILSTLPSNAYGNLSGTSMATPLVAGLVALMKSQARSLGRPEIFGAAAESILQSTGVRVGIETACMCRVDAAAALNSIREDRIVMIPMAATYAPNATAHVSAMGGSGGYRFQSQNTAVLDVAADGTLTAHAVGETTVRVTDSLGNSTESLALRVVDSGGGGGGGGGDEMCPFEDPELCDAFCQIDPTFPWCP